MIIINGWKPLTIITKCSISHVAAVLDPPLVRSFAYKGSDKKNIIWLLPNIWRLWEEPSQSIFTRSIMKTPEQCVKSFQS